MRLESHSLAWYTIYVGDSEQEKDEDKIYEYEGGADDFEEKRNVAFHRMPLCSEMRI